ncbi:TonB-dependent receptor [Marinilabiliaceae bacterium JC017]|nr:TonB-dependent receptor [Marinilabiliaceae bacterium JC017]
MRKNITLLLFMSVLTNHIWGQATIEGTITSDKDGIIIPGVNVYTQELKHGTASTTDGSYSLNVEDAGDYTLIFSTIGYDHKEVKISVKEHENVHVDVKLEESNFRMNEVIVVGENEDNKTIKKIKQSPMAVSIIDGRDFKGRVSGVNEILSRTAGIKIRQEGGLGSNAKISVHGLEGNRVAIFINGFALNSPDGSFNINDIAIDIIERIEVYKGIVPAEFGGDGLGGAINIVTREVDCDVLGASIEGGTYGLRKYNLMAKKLFDKPGIQIAAAVMHSEATNNYEMDLTDFDHALDPETYSHCTRLNDEYMSRMLFAGITFTKLWFDKIEFEFPWYKNYKGIQAITFDSRSAHRHGTNFMPVIKLEKHDFFVKGLDFKSSFVTPIIESHLVDTTTTMYYWDGQTTPSSRGETDDHRMNYSTDKTKEARHKLNLKYKISDQHTLNLNNQYVYSKNTPNDPYLADYLGFDPSAFPSKMQSNVTGLSHEYFSKNKRLQNLFSIKSYNIDSEIFRTTEKLIDEAATKQTPAQTTNNSLQFGFNEGVAYEIYNGTRLKLAFEHAVRLPRPHELFGDGLGIIPGHDLKPEKSNNVNLGLLMNHYNMLGTQRLQFEVGTFYKDVKDMIKLGPTPDGKLTHDNMQNILIKGFETEIKLDITPQWYVYGNFTYQDLRNNKEFKTDDKTSKNDTYNKRVPNIPWLFYNAGIEYHRSGLFKKELTRIYYDFSYIHEYHYDWKMSDRKDNEFRWKIPSQAIHYAGIQQSFLNNLVSINIEIANIFNQKAYDNHKMPLPGRTIMAKIKYSWFRDKAEGGAMGL